MSRARDHVSSDILTELLTAALVVLLAIGVITHLRETAPTPELDLAIEAPGEPATAPAGADVACQRRGPGIDIDRDELDPPPASDRITSSQITECPTRYDGHRITYVGEVIGDVLRRDGGAWVLVNDDPYALEVGPMPTHQQFSGGNSGVAVWLPDELVGLVDRPGDYDARGTVLRIRGTVHRADPADGGGLTLRADDAEVVAPSVELPHPVHGAQAIVAVLAALAALALVALERHVARTR